VLDDMDNGMRGGSKLLTLAAIDRGEAAGLQVIQEFSRDQRPIMANLVNRLKGPAKGRAAESLALLDRIKQRAGSLQQTAKCPGGVKAPVDELGALPASCAKAAPQRGGPAGAAPEVTASPVAPTAGATTGPEAEATAGTTPSVEAGSSSAPDAAAGEDSDEGVVDSIKKALESLFG
jgi:hypothetical protein